MRKILEYGTSMSFFALMVAVATVYYFSGDVAVAFAVAVVATLIVFVSFVAFEVVFPVAYSTAFAAFAALAASAILSTGAAYATGAPFVAVVVAVVCAVVAVDVAVMGAFAAKKGGAKEPFVFLVIAILPVTREVIGWPLYFWWRSREQTTR